MTAYAIDDLEPSPFDERVAPGYDAGSAHMFAPEVLGPTVDVLHELAGKGPALELAIGTGRVALPLTERGVEVHGIDFSEAMVAQLRSKPGGDRLPVTIGDMATTQVGSGYRVAYLVYNTITNLLTQDAQVECFRTVAAQLAPGGAFVIEVFVPQLRRMPPGQTAVPFHVGQRHVGFDTVDVVTQLSVSHHYTQAGEDADGRRIARYGASAHRYVWPAELDLMARIAGLTLRDRWADWDRSPFTAESQSHVSVWTKAAE
ncbi:methyltransferase [Terrabacter tumescens]|uniref:Methyltransferase n=1 Tax=Terrabacter tumescens TaxID=60443 RepID=A0ABQ2IBV9_9MICO|nr:class I SAM-dependent methyltransferase [Terrabacter tumescens]GGN05379.1 methyltransferase [Terrabacter tumescens]